MRQPDPVCHLSHSKDFLPNIKHKFPLFPFVPVSPSHITTVSDEESLSGFPLTPSDPVRLLWILIGISFSPGWTAQFSQPVVGELLQFSYQHQLHGSPLDLLQHLPCALYVGGTRSVHSTLGGVSQGQRGAGESTPSTCCPQPFRCTRISFTFIRNP